MGLHRRIFNTHTIQFYFKGEYFLIGDTVRIEVKDQTIVGSVVDIEQRGEFQRLYISTEEQIVLKHIGTAYDN